MQRRGGRDPGGLMWWGRVSCCGANWCLIRRCAMEETNHARVSTLTTTLEARRPRDAQRRHQTSGVLETAEPARHGALPCVARPHLRIGQGGVSNGGDPGTPQAWRCGWRVSLAGSGRTLAWMCHGSAFRGVLWVGRPWRA